MAIAREIMHAGAECIKEQETLATAASRMRELQVGALPICGSDDKLRGILTDRDIVVKAIAHGRDPHTTTVRELAQGTPIWVDANATVDEAIQKMVDNKVRRLPVMEDRRLVGMICEADLARNCNQQEVAHFVSGVYTAPPTRL
jgi:CBS domain-containing protein